MNQTEFWDLVQSLLDDRRDPREDDRVPSYLAQNPRELPMFERLVGRLEGVAGMPHARPARPVGRVLPIAAASAAAILAVLLLNRDTDQPSPAPQEDLAGQSDGAHSPLSAVVHYRLTIEHEGPQGHRATVIENGRVTRSAIQHDAATTPVETHLSIARTPRRIP